VLVGSEHVSVTSNIVELALEFDPMQSQVVKEALKHIHTQQDSNSDAKPCSVHKVQEDTICREIHSQACKDRFLEEDEGELLMRKRQCPETEV